MTKKTADERAQELQDKIKRDQARLAKIKREVASKERKERTHRLVEVGAIASKFLVNDDSLNQETAAAIFSEIVKLEPVKDILKKYSDATTVPSSDTSKSKN